MKVTHGGDFASRHSKWMRKTVLKQKELPDPFDSFHRGGNRGKPKNSKRQRVRGFRVSFKHLEVDICIGEEEDYDGNLEEMGIGSVGLVS